jgi:hypothetical protein
MLRFTKNDYIESSDFDDIMASDFVLEDKRFQGIILHGLVGEAAPTKLDNMGEGWLFLKDKGMVFICTDEPKSPAKAAAQRAADIAPWYLAGALGGAVKGLVDFGLEMKRFDKKIEKGLSSSNTFVVSFSDIVSIDVVKFGGIFGKLKDVALKLGVRSADNVDQVCWVEGKAMWGLADEDWVELIIQSKCIDEATRFAHEFMYKETRCKEYVDSIVSDWKQSGKDAEEEVFRTQLMKRAAEYMQQEFESAGHTEETVRSRLQGHLEQYKNLVSSDVYNALTE